MKPRPPIPVPEVVAVPVPGAINWRPWAVLLWGLAESEPGEGARQRAEQQTITSSSA